MTYKRKEVIGNCTLYLGDCLEVVGGIEQDFILITDPPFGTQDLGCGYGRRQKYSKDGKNGRTIKNDKDLSFQAKLFELLKITNSYSLVFYSSRNIKDFLDSIADYIYSHEIIWDKKQMGLGYTVRYRHESIAVIDMGGEKKINFAMPSIITYHQLEKLHPHQKPVGLMQKLISWQDGVVFDPFMGVASTGVACAKMGRSFIGIELDEEYFNIACKRIEDAYRQGDLFV